MSVLLLSRRDLDFLLYEWLNVEALTMRPRYGEHSRETFDAALDTYERIAREHFAPHNKKNDQHEPRLDGGRVSMNPEVREAVRAFADAGLMAAVQDEGVGGMQLPHVVERAGMAYMFAANIGSAGYPFLTMANAALLIEHGGAALLDSHVRPLLRGKFLGTMCLSEPQAGSSLADLTTRALRQSDGSYRIFGNKMWISAGDHELSENIVHLVLAKIPAADGGLLPGIQGISLFAVGKYLIEPDGSTGARNDVALAGLNHKMGYRGTTNCVLNFGEGRYLPKGASGAIGTLIGEAGQGLAYMFHMMNEARIGVGVSAAALGYSAYLHALDYARLRRQGRSRQRAEAASTPVRIIEHADVRRMLLAQKVYVEGALALVLYTARLMDEQRTASAVEALAAKQLLDLLTPITKSWPSQWCLVANDLAIQVHGGYGYTRDYNVEQLYRDNRLNPIHEGTQGIQAIDLLGRKVSAAQGAGFISLGLRLTATVQRARQTDLAGFADDLQQRWEQISSVTSQLMREADVTTRLANASCYLDALGHVTVGWLWLEQALTAQEALRNGLDEPFYRGKLQACRYFFRWELPKLGAWLQLLAPIDTTCLDMHEAWF